MTKELELGKGLISESEYNITKNRIMRDYGVVSFI